MVYSIVYSLLFACNRGLLCKYFLSSEVSFSWSLARKSRLLLSFWFCGFGEFCCYCCFWGLFLFCFCPSSLVFGLWFLQSHVWNVLRQKQKQNKRQPGKWPMYHSLSSQVSSQSSCFSVFLLVLCIILKFFKLHLVEVIEKMYLPYLPGSESVLIYFKTWIRAS